MPTKHAPLFASHRAAPEWSTDLTSARGWQAPVGAAPGSLAGVTFLHLGKAGGQSLQFGLKKLAGRGAFNTLVQVHDARDRWNYSMTGGKGRYVSMRGPLHVGEPSPRRARAEALIADYPVVLWVRDPVSRFVSCWEAWLNSGNATVTATRRQRWSANLLRATGRSVQAGDLDGALLALRSSKNFTLTRRVLATIEHADLDLAWYVGNVAGIGDVERRLGLVGALERMTVDWRRLTRWLGEDEPNATRVRVYQTVKLLHTHEKPRLLGVLSADAVDFLRRFYAADLRCIRYLCKRGWLPVPYYEALRNESNVYPY